MRQRAIKMGLSHGTLPNFRVLRSCVAAACACVRSEIDFHEKDEETPEAASQPNEQGHFVCSTTQRR